MRSHYLKTLKTAVLAISVLLLGASVSFAQQQVNLIAGPANATLPDGNVVPMWGYTCGTLVSGSTATCSAANPAVVTTPASLTAAAVMTGWSPVVITVPTGQSLQINLTNSLSFVPPSATVPNPNQPNNIPTSLVIVGQLGGGLGVVAQRTTTVSPIHQNMGTTWPIANTGGVFAPPSQGPRVQSFSTEVPVGTTATALTWTAPRAGTYLLESGTHPSIQGPMGLYGIVVVTAAPAGATVGTAYPGVSYNTEVPLLLSEIDPAQNNAVQAAVSTVGFSESAVHGPYGSMPVGSINLISGGSGYTSAPTVNCVMTGQTPTVCATAVIDSTAGSPTQGQVTEVDLIANPPSYTSAPNIVFSGGCTPTPGCTAVANAALLLQQNTAAQCSNGTLTGCYPPAVNYTPLYYLINGQAFDKTHASASLFAAAPGTSANPVTGKVLVRLVNAGLRMHVPSIVGSVSTPPMVPTNVTAALVPGFSLIAEDGNPLPGVSRVQSEVFMPAGKTYDVMIDVPTSTTALPIYDRELSLSSNSTGRDGGMLAYIGVNGAGLPTFNAAAAGAAVARADTYNSVIAGQTFTVSDPGKGVIANDSNVYGVQVLAGPSGGALTLYSNGTFTYTANAGTASDSFTYCANGTVTGGVCSSGITATVTLGAASVEAASGIVCSAIAFNSNVASAMSIKPPGVLAACKDGAGYPLTVDTSTIAPGAGLTVSVDPNGGFNATVARCTTAAGCPYSFTFKAKNSQGITASATGTANLTFAAGSGLTVTVLDGSDKKTIIQDYRWLIEEDRTFYINPNTTTNTGGIVPTFGTNFHTSYMPVIAAGCTGALSCESGQSVQGTPAVCDVGNGVCRTTGSQQATLATGDVHLDPTKRYYLTVFPGDAANPFNAGYGGNPACTANASNISTPNPNCGHGMGGAPIQFPAPNTAVTVYTQPSPYPTAKLSVFVFEDDFPLNGEQDGGGGIDVLSPNEPGLGGFNIKLFDDAGGTGDATGQVTYDMFNMPLSNSLAGTLDPMSGLDACPLSAQATASSAPGGDGSQVGITGEIVTCPKYEADGLTLSPLAGQAVVGNLFAGRYGIVATPAADRIARGEEWLQTNTLDGQKAHDSFLRIGEPSFFQEYGPAGFHVSIGFANPAIINGRLPYLCDGNDANSPTPGTGFSCTSGLTGTVTGEHLSRAPDERLYSSGDNSTFGFTQCYVSVGDPDGEDFAFTKCDSNGKFSFTGLPEGDWRITVFDQWNDMLVDGLSTPVRLAAGQTLNFGDIATSQWQANIYTSTFFDNKGSGVFTDYSGTQCPVPQTTPPTPCNPNFGVSQPGLALVATNIRFRDGSYSNFNNTDLFGNAGYNEVFPLFSWYVVEDDTTRYKSTGVHVVYDAGGPTDGSPSCIPGTTAPCGHSNIAGMMANTAEAVSVPLDLRVPGAIYCATADCSGKSLAAPVSDPPSACTTDTTGKTTCTTQLSTGRIDPPFWFGTYGWQGFSGQNSFLEFGKKLLVPGETGTIHGEVIYASTRPFDDPSLLIHTSWTPDVPNVTINLYQEGTAPDGSTSLTLVDTTKTTSWDDWAQGFYANTSKPYMNCPGQMPAPTTTNGGDLFFFSLFNQPMWLDQYNHGGVAANTIPHNSQFKCYDGMHNWNQLQPAPYDGMYSFPSITGLDPNTGAPTGTNCTICTFNPDSADPYRYGGGKTGTWSAGAGNG
ncbi:MAG TPA: Ig-like domain-containing protein, partial [Steroidobacteraceae bacterium]